MQSQGQACYVTYIFYIYQPHCDLCSVQTSHFALKLLSDSVFYFVSKNSYSFRAVDS